MKRVFCYSFLVSFFILCLSSYVFAATHHVPDDYSTIQKAIDASSYGDTVMVAAGYYAEHITLKSGVKVLGAGMDNTHLSGTHSGSVVSAVDVNNAQFSGFWVYYAGNGGAEAGIKISGGNLIISNNKISHNPRYGIYIFNDSSAIIRNNIIQYNGDSNDSFVNYGLIVLKASPLITNNLVCRNIKVGIYVAWVESAGTRIINNTIFDNGDDGIWCCCSAPPVIKNNIVVSNGNGIAASHDARPEISYNDVWNNSYNDYDSQEGGVARPGTGDISEDPQFSNTSDFYLDGSSPCIDAGDPAPAYNDIDGTRNDMGAYGGPDGSSNNYNSPIESGFVFTNIGKIPVSEIIQTGITQTGLADVSQETASELHIYPYHYAPFGGSLWINGMFGTEDTNVTYYQILVAKWNGSRPPLKGSFKPLTDPLTKIKYIINSDGTVTAKRITLGPKSIAGVNGLYERTASGYWAYRDLKIVWNTAWMEDGLYDITYKAYRYSGFPFPNLTEVSLPANDLSRITLRIDNAPVTADIEVVQHDGHDIEECSIIGLDNVTDNLTFRITARHPHGYLDNYYLNAIYGANHSGGTIVSDHFTGVHDTTPIWYGVSSQEFDSIDAMNAGHLDPWENCAYQFHLRVWARTTDGFNRIRWADFNDHYYLQIHDNKCAGDLDGDGVVDGTDLAKFSRDYGREDCLE